MWYPEAMGLADSGDLAWSFGPWTYAAKRGEAILVNGHFLSLWRLQSPGRWKVEADIGIPHAAPDRASDPFAPWDAPFGKKKGRQKARVATPAIRNKKEDLSVA